MVLSFRSFYLSFNHNALMAETSPASPRRCNHAATLGPAGATAGYPQFGPDGRCIQVKRRRLIRDDRQTAVLHRARSAERPAACRSCHPTAPGPGGCAGRRPSPPSLVQALIRGSNRPRNAWRQRQTTATQADVPRGARGEKRVERAPSSLGIHPAPIVPHGDRQPVAWRSSSISNSTSVALPRVRSLARRGCAAKARAFPFTMMSAGGRPDRVAPTGHIQLFPAAAGPRHRSPATHACLAGQGRTLFILG